MASLRYDYQRLRAGLRDDLRLPPAKYLPQTAPAPPAAAAAAAAASSSSSSSSSNGGGDAEREALMQKVTQHQQGLSEALQELLRYDNRVSGADHRDPEPSTMVIAVTSTYKMDSHIIGTGRLNDPFVRTVVSNVITSATLDSEQFVNEDRDLYSKLYKQGAEQDAIAPAVAGPYYPVVPFDPLEVLERKKERARLREEKKLMKAAGKGLKGEEEEEEAGAGSGGEGETGGKKKRARTEVV